jgi:hypothetical protein
MQITFTLLSEAAKSVKVDKPMQWDAEIQQVTILDQNYRDKVFSSLRDGRLGFDSRKMQDLLSPKRPRRFSSNS